MLSCFYYKACFQLYNLLTLCQWYDTVLVMNTQKTVFVGLSGGVDSSVAALRLINDGYNVVGVFIKVWHPDFMVCNWEQERLDAMRVAAHLDIPFLTCDAEAEYRDEVAKVFIDEYRQGRTPNPDVMCNQHVKFGAFLRFAEAKGADCIATGHYAQNIANKNGDAELHRGIDTNKDQTYFLWTLSNAQLEKSMFPVGNTDKEEIRKEANVAGIPTAQKKDSQGICFLGHVDIPEFLSHYIDLVPGNVLNIKGDIVGSHQGALVYTLGQRHGFSITTKDNARTALFVIERDIDKNTITVDTAPKRSTADADTIELCKILLRCDLQLGENIDVQYRYRQKFFSANVTLITDDRMSIKPTETFEQPAIGQSCVLYRGMHCIGGGIVT